MTKRSLPTGDLPPETLDLIEEQPNPFFNPQRISRAIFDPKKNFLKTIWQKEKYLLDSELNEREDIDNYIRRQILFLLAGEISIVHGLCPMQNHMPNKICFCDGQIVVRGWNLLVEKNEGGFPSVNQNFEVVVVGPEEDGETYPHNGLGFNPNMTIEQPVGDGNATIIANGTHYNLLKRILEVELENTCSNGPVCYRVQTIDKAYSETFCIPPHSTHVYTLREDLRNCVTLPVTNSSAPRYDYIYLQVGEVELSSMVSVVKRNGHMSNPETLPSDILDPVMGEETTRRTQVQFDIRACAGGIPEAPNGYYIYPLFRVLRKPGDPFVKLEDVKCLITRIDVGKTGLFDLITQGAGITFDSPYAEIIDINDVDEVTPPTCTVVVGSTVSFRNCGPTEKRSLRINNGIYDESFVLEVKNDSYCVNFSKAGDYTLIDAHSGTNLMTVHVIPWSSGGLSKNEFEKLHCAIGQHYFEGGHVCDDSADPDWRVPSEQSLDTRIESLTFDNFEMALCMAATKGQSTLRLTYMFVDSFRDLNFIQDGPEKDAINCGPWIMQKNWIEVP